MSDIDPVSILALVVAAVALVVAAGQFLQQIYGTADGYRRCQPSVIGEWSRRTRLSWRWSQFRFETKFATPHFSTFYSVGSSASGKVDMIDSAGTEHWFIENTDETRLRTMSPRIKSAVDRPDVVSWASLIDQLHYTQERYRLRIGIRASPTQNDPAQKLSPPSKRDWVIISPTIRPREWSWDLMPPDLIRPLATCDMRTIIILAHHMGMVWRTLRPSDGVMIAEGNGQSLSGTRTRGLGMVMQYTFEDGLSNVSYEEVVASLRVPSAAAIQMSFGIILGGELISFDRCDIHVAGDDPKELYNISMIASALQRFGIGDDTIAIIRKSAHNSSIDRELITTCIHPLRKDLYTPFERREGRIIWRHLLQSKASLMPQQKWVLDELNFYANNFEPAFWHTYSPRGNKPDDYRLVERLRETHDETTRFFQKACESSGRPFYTDLARCQISVAAKSMEEYDLRHSQRTTRDASVVPGVRSNSLSERSFIYVDNIPKIQQKMKQCDSSYDMNLVEDAWWTMMLRAVVWYLSTYRLLGDEVPPVPSYYLSSRTPVYIS